MAAWLACVPCLSPPGQDACLLAGSSATAPIPRVGRAEPHSPMAPPAANDAMAAAALGAEDGGALEWRCFIKLKEEPERAAKVKEDLGSVLEEGLTRVFGASVHTQCCQPTEVRTDRYVAATHELGLKLAGRTGGDVPESKALAWTDPHSGAERWCKSTADVSLKVQGAQEFRLEKERRRWKLKKMAKQTDWRGVKAVEITQVNVMRGEEGSGSGSDAGGSEADGRFVREPWLSVCVEAKTSEALQRALADLAIVDAVARCGPLMRNATFDSPAALCVSYPRFVALLGGWSVL